MIIETGPVVLHEDVWRGGQLEDGGRVLSVGQRSSMWRWDCNNISCEQLLYLPG